VKKAEVLGVVVKKSEGSVLIKSEGELIGLAMGAEPVVKVEQLSPQLKTRHDDTTPRKQV